MTAKSQTLGGIHTKKSDGTKKTGAEMKDEVADRIFEVFGRVNFSKQFTSDVTDAASIAYTYYLTGGVNPTVAKKEAEKAAKKEKKSKGTK